RSVLDALCVGHDSRAVSHGPVTVHVPGDGEAVPRERDRRLDGLLPRDRAEPGQRLMEARHGARHRHRPVADVVDPTVEHVAVTVGGFADEDRVPLVFTDLRPGRGATLETRVTWERAAA